MLFILFLTEGLAVGVGFGAIGKTASATFENARYYIIIMLLNWTNNKAAALEEPSSLGHPGKCFGHLIVLQQLPKILPVGLLASWLLPFWAP